MTWKKGILAVLVPIAVFILASYATISILLKTGATVVCPDVRGLMIEDAKRLTEDERPLFARAQV